MISSYKIRYYTHPGSTQATQAAYPLHIVSILYKGLLQEILGTHMHSCYVEYSSHLPWEVLHNEEVLVEPYIYMFNLALYNYTTTVLMH